MHRRRGLILIVVLVMVALLALLAASYTFLVRANLSEAIAYQQQFQARQAAESGIQAAIGILRAAKNDPGVYYNNPSLCRAQPVNWIDAKAMLGTPGGPQKKNTLDNDAALSVAPDAQGAVKGQTPPVWRYSLVAPNFDDRTTVRYGITDENARLNLNTATSAQLLRLFSVALPQSTTDPIDINVLTDSLLDWRSTGTTPRTNGAKDSYYNSLHPPYRCKSAAFSTVEELLQVRGFNAWILFGEDYNRNGMLDPNEDDGDASFPPDNADGALFAGIAPFLTLWSQEMNVSKDGRQRINLNMRDAQKLQDALAAEFDSNIVNYVAEVRGSGKAFNSVMNLIPAPPPPPKDESAEQNPPSTQPSTSQPARKGGIQMSASPPASSSDLGQSKSGSGKKPTTSQPAFSDLTSTPPPGTLEMLPQILDRLTVNPVPFMSGRINVSTAPREVLATILALTDEEINTIVAGRAEITPQERSTPAWLLTKGLLSQSKFRQILGKITTNSSVFRVESIGYADHVGVVERVQVVLEMRGPVPQVLYTRNLSGLGTAYDPHNDERRTTKELAN